MLTSPVPILGVIFDCDGTLVDSETLSAQLASDMLGEYGITIAPDAMLARLRGHKFQNIVIGLAAQYPQIDAETFIPAYRARSLPILRERLQPIAGAVELVRSLHIKKCVASNGPRQKIETCLEAVGLLDAFEGMIVSAFEVGAWKPDPAMILYAADLLDLPPENCVLIEDSVPGIRAGLAAGVRVLGFGEADFSSVLEHSGFRRIDALGDILHHIQASSRNADAAPRQ